MQTAVVVQEWVVPSLNKKAHMKKHLLTLAGAALTLFASAAHAGQYRLDFTASGFIDMATSESTGAGPVIGSFLYTARDMGFPVDSIDSVDLVIAGHRFTVDEISTRDGTMFDVLGHVGGPQTGVDTSTFTLEPGNFYYWTQTENVFQLATVFNAAYGQIPLAVPEPATVALFAGAAVAVGVVRRRRTALQPPRFIPCVQV